MKPLPETGDRAVGSRKGPIVWLLLRAFCLLMLSTQGLAVAFFVAGFADPVWTDETLRGHPEQIGMARLICAIFAVIFGLPLLPMIPALVCPRSRVGWYLGVVTLFGGIFTTCGWPIAIPLVVYWFHPDVQSYSGFAVSKKGP